MNGNGRERPVVDLLEYKIIKAFSYDDFCDFLKRYRDRVIKDAEDQISEEALKVATHNLLGDAEAAHIMDEEEALKRLMSVKGISKRLADLCLQALETE